LVTGDIFVAPFGFSGMEEVHSVFVTITAVAVSTILGSLSIDTHVTIFGVCEVFAYDIFTKEIIIFTIDDSGNHFSLISFLGILQWDILREFVIFFRRTLFIEETIIFVFEIGATKAIFASLEVKTKSTICTIWGVF
jgi:hypothetical protein